MVTFSEAVYLSSIHLTDLFNENGYLEEARFRLSTAPGVYVDPVYSKFADTGQTLGSTNGVLIIDTADALVWGIGFGTWGDTKAGQNHEFSLASLRVNPVPEPATAFLLGIGLVGLASVGKKKLFKK